VGLPGVAGFGHNIPMRHWTPVAYYSGNFRVLLRQQIVRELAGEPKRILDLGCGSAAISLGLPHEHVTGVDNSPAMVAVAKGQGPASFEAVECDLHDFLGAEPYDLALCLGVLAHVPRPRRVLETIACNLATEGRVIVQLCDRRQPLNWLWGWRYRLTSRREVLRDAAELGLIVVEERQHLVLFPGLDRLLGRFLLPYDRWVQRTWLAKLGTNHIILLRRAPRDAGEEVARDDINRAAGVVPLVDSDRIGGGDFGPKARAA
jgi:SAM-dependent methyltransferase